MEGIITNCTRYGSQGESAKPGYSSAKRVSLCGSIYQTPVKYIKDGSIPQSSLVKSGFPAYSCSILRGACTLGTASGWTCSRISRRSPIFAS